MKTKFFTICILALSIMACHSKTKIETKQIQTTDQTSEWKISIQRTAFFTTDIQAEQSYNFFNDEIKGLNDGIQAAFQEQAHEQNIRLDSIREKQMAPYELYITDSIFSANENFFSVRVSSYEMLGGAHGITNFYGINYDVKTKQFLSPKDILNVNKTNEINALLKEYLKDPEQCYTFASPTIDNLTALNFTNNSLDFTYAQYVLGPGSCGPVIISIPKTKMQGLIRINL